MTFQFNGNLSENIAVQVACMNTTKEKECSCASHMACTQKSHTKLYVHMYINSDPSAPHAYKPSFNEKG